MRPADVSPTRFAVDGGETVYNYLSNFGWAQQAGVGTKVPAVSPQEQVLFVCHAMGMDDCGVRPPPLEVHAAALWQSKRMGGTDMAQSAVKRGGWWVRWGVGMCATGRCAWTRDATGAMHDTLHWLVCAQQRCVSVWRA